MLNREAIENQLETLTRSRDELRPPGKLDKRLSSLVVTDRIDRHGNYLHVDPIAEDLLGFPPDYYANEVDWVRFNHAFDIDRVSVLWESALRGRPCRGVEYRTDHSAGYWVWLEDSFVPILEDRRGQALVVEGRWHDITPRKRCQIEFLIEQLELSLRALKSPPRSGSSIILRFPRLEPDARRRISDHRGRSGSGSGVPSQKGWPK